MTLRYFSSAERFPRSRGLPIIFEANCNALSHCWFDRSMPRSTKGMGTAFQVIVDVLFAVRNNSNELLPIQASILVLQSVAVRGCLLGSNENTHQSHKTTGVCVCGVRIALAPSHKCLHTCSQVSTKLPLGCASGVVVGRSTSSVTPCPWALLPTKVHGGSQSTRESHSGLVRATPRGEHRFGLSPLSLTAALLVSVSCFSFALCVLDRPPRTQSQSRTFCTV